MSNDHPPTPIADAAKRAIEAAGGGSKLAKACGVTKSAVSQWKRLGVPPEQALRVAHLTGIPAAELRPDLVQPVAA